MSAPLSEILTARFYEWEQRGRGWYVFPFTVELEPEFYPFFGHFAPTMQIVDDNRHPTILSSIADFIKGRKKVVLEENPFTEIPPVTAYKYDGNYSISVYSVVLPKGEKLDVEDIMQLLLMLSYTDHPVSFEIVATSAAIGIQFAVRDRDAQHVYGQIKAYFPTAVLTKNDEGLEVLLDGTNTCIVDFGLQDEFMRPLRLASELDQDPYVGLFATLENLQKGECGVIQVMFKGVTHPWAQSIMRSVTDSKGGSFFEDAPDMVKLAQEKVSTPLFSVCIKVAGQSNIANRANEITKNISAALMRLTNSKGNQLVALSQENYSIDDLIGDMYLRQSHRLGMILSCKELATIAHFPTDEIVSPKVARDTKKTKAAPESAQGNEFVIGMNTYHGEEQTVSIPSSLRLRHMHIIGATGTGKSTMLLSMIAQDMVNGNGLAVLDPHGDLIESILAYVPANRLKDVIVIDPSDGEYPVGFNILSAHSEIEKDILSSDLVAAFKRLSTSWGDQMNSVFANAILAFLESKLGGTLVDLRRFLVEKPFRDAYLKTVPDPHVVYYWQHEYPLLKSNSIGSILTRLDTFLRPKLIRNMVAQKKSLDFESILDTKKILLIKLSQGLIGAENSFLLGTFFVSKMYQAAMARQAKSKAERGDYFLYIDEFQNFITPSMSYILSGARKYHLGLILAHQDMMQLQKYDTELASSVVVNPGTRICFRLGDTDAKRFAQGFSYFEPEDLENLHVGEAIARIEQPNFDFSLTTIPLPEIKPDVAEQLRQMVIDTSRAKYGTPKEQVEESLSHLGKVEPEAKEPDREPVPNATEREQPLPEELVPAPAAFIPVVIPTKTPAKPKVDSKHLYLQMLIKKMAESRGYKAAIEETTPDGKGRVDVSLERDSKRIACEVSVTTDDTWEIHNVEKCLKAGYDEVIVCSDDLKNLERIRKQVANLSTDQQKNVQCLESKEVIQYFDSQTMPETKTEKVVKGYRVKTEYSSSTTGEMTQMKENIVKVVSDSMKKTRTKKT